MGKSHLSVSTTTNSSCGTSAFNNPSPSFSLVSLNYDRWDRFHQVLVLLKPQFGLLALTMLVLSNLEPNSLVVLDLLAYSKDYQLKKVVLVVQLTHLS